MSDFAPFERKKPGSPPPQSSYTVYDDSGTHALESLHSTDRLGAGDDHTLDIRGSVTSPFETLSERLLVPEHSVELVEINELYGHHTHSITPTLFSDVRHGLKVPLDPNALVTPANIVSRWRQKDRLKTTAVALVVCLNIGVDPPGVIKISPGARLECWLDPLSMQAQKALDTIGKNLQRQYERLVLNSAGGLGVELGRTRHGPVLCLLCRLCGSCGRCWARRLGAHSLALCVVRSPGGSRGQSIRFIWTRRVTR